MRINQSYWIWGQFSKKDTLYLNSIKDNVQIFLKSPKFDIHLTISGPYEKLGCDFLNNLKNLSNKNQSIILNLEKFDFSDEKFKSFFIKTTKSIELNNFRNSIYKLSKFASKYDYDPHISLAYGSHKKYNKDLLISKMSRLRKKILLSKISLVYVNEELNIWRILNNYELKILDT